MDLTVPHIETSSNFNKETEKEKVISNSHTPALAIPLSEKTKVIGRFDEWNRKKFETLQANTQQQFIEYHKMLAYYQNELDRFRGKKAEEKLKTEGTEDQYIIPNEEKTFSAGEFDTWSQEKFDELEENAKRQFHEYDLLLERYKKRLDKYNGKEDCVIQTIEQPVTNKETIDDHSIIEKIEQIISDFFVKLILIDNEKNKENIYTPKPLSEVFILKNEKWWNKLNWNNILGFILILIALWLIFIKKNPK